MGLSDDYYIMNNYKWDNLIRMSTYNYTYMKELLGIADYDYFIQVLDLQGNELYTFSNYSGYTESVVWNENVLINGSLYELKVGVVG